MLPTKHVDYNNIPFTSELPQLQFEFFTSATIQELDSKCRKYKEDVIKCRTIGILQSLNGIFFIKDISLPLQKPDTVSIQVSMAYLKVPLLSTAIPQTVQVFGTLEWHKRPVIYATMVQFLITPMALRLKQAVDGITNKHLARQDRESVGD